MPTECPDSFDADAHAETIGAFSHRLGHACDTCREIRRECPRLKANSIARMIADAVVEEAEVVNADAELAQMDKKASRRESKKRWKAEQRAKAKGSPLDRLARAIARVAT